MLFKTLVIQALYNLSDEHLEYQILDRTSFMGFLGLKKSDRVPDSRTFWHFREQLIAFGCIGSLFEAFNPKYALANLLRLETAAKSATSLPFSISP